MALNIAELIIFGLFVDAVFKKMKMPGLIGMLLLGIVIGPHVLNFLEPNLLNISSDLRMFALIVILLRAGFELSKDTLNRVGVRAMLLSFIPAVLEGLAITFLGHAFLRLSIMESAILGAVISAVSPAVVVPLMIHFMEKRKGTKKGIPTLILAASSIDDVFVIVVYSVLIGIYTGQKVNIVWKMAGIPISIILGIIVGLACGFLLYKAFDKYHPRVTKRLLIILGISIVLVSIEHAIENFIPFAALLAVMAIGFIILEKSEHMAHAISAKLNRLWVFAEIILFTLVGAQVNLKVAVASGLAGTAVVFIALIARSIGTYGCLIGSNLTIPERIFVVISYVPKATVQAAIGGAPLVAMKLAGMDTQPGEVILATAVLSILLTAPLGAWAIIYSGNRILEEDPLKIAESDGGAERTREDVERSFKAGDIMDEDVVILNEKDKANKVMEYFSAYDFLVYPVVNADNKLSGIVRLKDLRPILKEQHSWDWLVARDLSRSMPEEVYESSSLQEALKIAKSLDCEQIPILEDKTEKVVGILDVNKAQKFIEQKFIELTYANDT